MTEKAFDPPQQDEVERQILIESLALLYRSMPTAALGHAVAAGFITYALYGAITSAILFAWMGCVVVVATARVGVTAFVEQRIARAPFASIQRWSNLLATLTFVQTSIWGASVFVIWPDDIALRALLITILAGIVATGGIMLSLHRRSFIVYCLPIALPAVSRLFMSGSEIETILGILFAFFSVLIYASVNRLTQMFRKLLRVRHMMQTESRTDALTQLANRRGFDENMQDTWQRAVRAQQPIGLLIIDVDYFKDYNDYYGHPQGDIALKKLGELFRKIASRSTDFCARIGGEEFAVIMPTTELEGSLQVAQTIMDELAQARIPHQNCLHGLLTLSIGLNVAKPGRDGNRHTFLMEADQALYEAKESGRNQICIARSLQKTPTADNS